MSREFIKIDKKVGLNPRERDIFKYAAYFDCEKFNYTYSSAVNSYNYAHNGSSTHSHINIIKLCPYLNTIYHMIQHGFYMQNNILRLVDLAN